MPLIVGTAFGSSTLGAPIDCTVLGAAGPTFIVLGGMHGDEPKSVFVARSLVADLAISPIEGCRIIVAPVVNPDGFLHRKRKNAGGVDINRNFPTQNWAATRTHSRMYGGVFPGSEPETRATISLVTQHRPRAIVTIHSIDKGRYCNNFDGPGEALAICMSQGNHYPTVGTIGYPTPGSFGTWAGAELGIPVITLELPSSHSRIRCWRDNREALRIAAQWAAESLTPTLPSRTLGGNPPNACARSS